MKNRLTSRKKLKKSSDNLDFSITIDKNSALDPETEVFFCIKQKHFNQISEFCTKLKTALKFRVNRTLRLDEMVIISQKPEIDGLDPLINEIQLDNKL